MLAGHIDPDPQGFVESSCSEVVSGIIVLFNCKAFCLWLGPQFAAVDPGQITSEDATLPGTQDAFHVTVIMLVPRLIQHGDAAGSRAMFFGTGGS